MKTPLNWLRTHLRGWLGIEKDLAAIRWIQPAVQNAILLWSQLEQQQREICALRGEIAMLKRDVDEKIRTDNPPAPLGQASIKDGRAKFSPNYTVPVITWDDGRVDVRTEPLDTAFPFDPPPPLEERMKLFGPIEDCLPIGSTITLKRPERWSQGRGPADFELFAAQTQPCEK